jgi:hypothetical protein
MWYFPLRLSASLDWPFGSSAPGILEQKNNTPNANDTLALEFAIRLIKTKLESFCSLDKCLAK